MSDEIVDLQVLKRLGDEDRRDVAALLASVDPTGTSESFLAFEEEFKYIGHSMEFNDSLNFIARVPFLPVPDVSAPNRSSSLGNKLARVTFRAPVPRSASGPDRSYPASVPAHGMTGGQ